MRLLIGVLLLGCYRTIDARVVAAKEDICTRHPEFFICRSNQGERPLPPQVPPASSGPGPSDSKPPDQPNPGAPLPPTPPPTQDKQPLDQIAYCNQYATHFTYFCGSSAVSNPNAAAFCQAYPVTCPQSAGPSGGLPSGVTPDQVVALCREKAPLAQQFCTGTASEPPQAKQQCDLWRQYCANNPAVAPSAQNNPQISQICSQYQYMADQYCPGYEMIQLRQYCNYYRVYCKGQKPFPNIDGNIGIVPVSWGVAGIPYYPFNPQGAIAGGDKIDVGFGDWGANVNRARGVTDFYEQNDQFDANWQRGNFGGGNSWNVPLVGIGGYNRAGVNLGGIANPSDLPGLLSGGVPQGLPLSGLGQIPLSQGIPINQFGTGNGVSTLNQPVGTGGLGTLGALARGAPLGAGPIGPLGQFGGGALPGAPLGGLGSSPLGVGTGVPLGLGGLG